MAKTLVGLCVLLMCSGCGPLRPFEAVRTGGRTALTQWEYQEALARIYQTQVLLNLIRMVEYGEAPLHFEFTDISATIRDDASIGIDLSFNDSPEGLTVVGNVAVPKLDTPVNLTPKTSTSRSVQILANARPVVRTNWIYEWYYTIAWQFQNNPELRWYRQAHELDSPGCENSDESPRLKSSDITVSYRLRNYQLRTGIKTPAGCFSPPEELGALTTILSLLTDSSPAQSITIPVTKIEKHGIDQVKLFLAEGWGAARRSLGGKALTLSIPRGASNSDFSVPVTVTLFTAKEDPISAPLTCRVLEIDALTSLSNAATAFEKLQDKGRGIRLRYSADPDEILLPSKHVLRLAQRGQSTKPETEISILKRILDQVTLRNTAKGG